MPSGIYPRTIEHNKNISLSLQGKPKSEISKKRLSDARKGRKHTESDLIKMRESSKKRWEKQEECLKISIANKGRKRSEETKKKLSIANKGKIISEEQRKLLSIIHTGKHLSEETKRKLSNFHKGRSPALETRIKLSEALRGEKSVHWRGGSSFEPYCVKFSREFKERVRAFFNYQCVECGDLQNGERLHIHHVNFNKQSCCDNSIPLFVALCRGCHMKTNFNREYWEQHFTGIINTYYSGKCYLTQEEMKLVGNNHSQR